LPDDVPLEDDACVGPKATFTNDPFPRGHHRPATVVQRGASIGANATILPRITIGTHAMAGAGAVVTREVSPQAIVVGNPAPVTDYAVREPPGTGRLESRMGIHHLPPSQRPQETVLTGGARLYDLPRIADERGNLTFAEIRQSLPFAAARYFLVFGVPNRRVRGEHAHRQLQQFLVCVHGRVAVRLFDGALSEEVCLDRPDLGLYVPPMLWTTQYKYSPDATLMVLASDIYREGDYIRDLDEFLALQGGT